MVRIFFYFFLITVLLLSCKKQQQRAELTTLVLEWQGKEVLFPDHAVFLRYGKDTVDFEYKNAGYKVLVYIDSAGCTGCALRAERWKAFIETVDSVSSRHVPFVFFISPKSIADLRFRFQQIGFDYPVCFNGEEELDRLNQFPQNSLFHTVLLDSDNRVLVIGNPTRAPKIAELYLNRITQGAAALPEKKEVTDIHLPVETINVPPVATGDTVKVAFEVVNVGEAPLYIEDAITDCDCTHASFTKEPVPSGTVTTIDVTIVKKETGSYVENITLFANTETAIKLTVTGIIK